MATYAQDFSFEMQGVNGAFAIGETYVSGRHADSHAEQFVSMTTKAAM